MVVVVVVTDSSEFIDGAGGDSGLSHSPRSHDGSCALGPASCRPATTLVTRFAAENVEHPTPRFAAENVAARSPPPPGRGARSPNPAVPPRR
jgi:hypothetical protein